MSPSSILMQTLMLMLRPFRSRYFGLKKHISRGRFSSFCVVGGFENSPPASESPVQSGRPIDLGILSDRD